MFGQLFSPVWFIVLFVLLAVCIYHARAIPRWMWLGFVFLVLALFVQSMLWFQALDIHDYYWITLFVFPAYDPLSSSLLLLAAVVVVVSSPSFFDFLAVFA